MPSPKPQLVPAGSPDAPVALLKLMFAGAYSMLAQAQQVPASSPNQWQPQWFIAQSRGAAFEMRDWFGQYAENPIEVRGFCERHEIVSDAVFAVSLARRTFENVESVRLSLEQDQDAGDEWVSVYVATKSASNRALNAYRQYSDRWLDRTKWPERYLVRVSYDII